MPASRAFHFLPSAGDDRQALLLARGRRWRGGGLLGREEWDRLQAHASRQWKRSRPLLRVVLFVLTLLGVAFMGWFFDLMGLPAELLAGAVSLALAEVLIQRGRLWHAGPEEALWIGGLLCFIFALPGPPSDEAWLLFSGAALIAGARLLQPMFLSGGVALLLVYAAVKVDLGEPPAFASLAVAFAALALLRKEWARPVVEHTLGLLVLFLPLLAWTFVRTVQWHEAKEIPLMAASLALGVTIAALGLVIRHHAAIVGGLLLTGVGLWMLAARLPWATELRFLIFGAALLIASALAIRLLRSHRSGLTSERLEEIEDASVLELAAVVPPSVAAQAEVPAGPQRGGEFGGGGASGDY